MNLYGISRLNAKVLIWLLKYPSSNEKTKFDILLKQLKHLLQAI